MGHYIVDTAEDETALFEEISKTLKASGVSAGCVLDRVIEIEANKNALDAISRAVAGYITDKLEEKKVRFILKKQGMNPCEINDTLRFFKEDSFNRCMRIKELAKGLKKALLSYGRINVEGLLNFRLKEYNYMLMRGIDMAVDDYISNRACEDFLNLLKYYVSIKDSRLESVTVEMKDGEYVIFDSDGEVVPADSENELFDEINISEYHADDILIGQLMNLAPLKITIHATEEKPVIKTLKRIFEEKLILV